ncbi:MAG: pilin [Patescibacteria group bacterium]|nr:pilin [Patescibacteria group bacterium]
MNKIIFSGLMVLVCCLFGGVGGIQKTCEAFTHPCEELKTGSLTPADFNTEARCRSRDCEWHTGVRGCAEPSAGCEVVGDYACSIKSSGSWSTGEWNQCANCDCSWCCCPVDKEGWGNLHSPKSVPKDLDEAMMNITNWLLGIISMIAVLVVIWGGINYLTAAGDEEKARKAKKIITYSLIGVAITGLAYGIIKVIIEVISK